ncbi:hypothetical protein U9M48_005193 [Paspalum notatum var. saurae]|uniref:Uncharacterized protein n=1 Tax=Paspalum notatum var. saurae TaxID=547442 RepID=A0AAQ3PLT0_PASNO
MHLEAEELIQGDVDWIMKDPEVWRWIYHNWAGSDFQGASDRNRGNRTSKPRMQRFGADGFIGKEQHMEAKSGIKPSFVDVVYIEGHKGSDPENPEVLCDEQATEKFTKYKENVIQRYGPEFDWRAAALDIEAIYHVGGELPHGKWGLGDGALEYDRIQRPQKTSQGCSSRRPSRAQQEAQQEETRRLREETRRLRENNDYMMTYLASFDLHNLIYRCHLTTSAVLSPKDHHLEMLTVGFDPMLQSFDLHNFSHRFHLTTSALLAAKDHHLEMLRVLSLLLTR